MKLILADVKKDKSNIKNIALVLTTTLIYIN